LAALLTEFVALTALLFRHNLPLGFNVVCLATPIYFLGFTCFSLVFTPSSEPEELSEGTDKTGSLRIDTDETP
jgi:hypothetical protein